MKRGKPGTLRYAIAKRIDAAKQTARAGVVAAKGSVGGTENMRTVAQVSDERHKGWALAEGEQRPDRDGVLLCPQCNSEWFADDGIDVCPDCNLELIEQ